MNSAHISHIIAVDGGGTGCRVAVASRSGEILGKAEGGPANISTNFDLAHQNITEVVHMAWKSADLDAGDFTHAVGVLGLAGANVGDYANRLTNLLPFAKKLVTDDRETTFQGALGGGEGCVAVVGTGSFFCGRVDGIEKSIGGWGFFVGDDGSGARLGQDLLRRVLHCHDGLENHSDLTQAILWDFGNQPGEIVDFSLHAKPGDFGRFAIRVVESARAGDINGLSLVRDAVKAAQASIDCVGFTGQQPVFMLGGLGRAFLQFMDSAYRDNATEPKGDALTGGISIAQEMIGEPHANK